MNLIKRLSIFALVLLAGIGYCNAQFRFGVKAGVNLNKLHLDNPVTNLNSDNGCGFTGGLMGEFEVPVVGVCFDLSLMYTRMNAEVVKNAGDNDVISSDAKNFFEIPINFKYKFNFPLVSNIVKPYLFTGPSFAFKLGGNDDVFKTKEVQCAWNLGVGVELVKHLQISGSYGWGINNIADKFIAINATDDIKVKNNYWTITAAYLF